MRGKNMGIINRLSKLKEHSANLQSISMEQAQKETIGFSYSFNDLDDTVMAFWAVAKAYPILAFSGEMGAGKTTFISRLCHYLQVEDAVSSPTFALINEYHFTDPDGRDTPIYHLDWYRLKNEDEAVNAGMEDCLDEASRGNAYCFIEWPEKALNLIRPPYAWISIVATDETHRSMQIKYFPG